MEFKFDAHQQYQQDAIAAVVDLFEGQPPDAATLETTLIGAVPESKTGTIELLDLGNEVGAVGNNLLLDDEAILQNLQSVQDRNGLEVVSELASNTLDFDVEMETGTGKTYVYLRTIFEMSKRYNFTKFVILVPSVAIKEGVSTSIKLMTKHFQDLYATPFLTFTGFRSMEPSESLRHASSIRAMKPLSFFTDMSFTYCPASAPCCRASATTICFTSPRSCASTGSSRYTTLRVLRCVAE